MACSKAFVSRVASRGFSVRAFCLCRRMNSREVDGVSPHRAPAMEFCSRKASIPSLCSRASTRLSRHRTLSSNDRDPFCEGPVKRIGDFFSVDFPRFLRILRIIQPLIPGPAVNCVFAFPSVRSIEQTGLIISSVYRSLDEEGRSGNEKEAETELASPNAAKLLYVRCEQRHLELRSRGQKLRSDK